MGAGGMGAEGGVHTRGLGQGGVHLIPQVVAFAEGEDSGQGEELVIIRGSARDIGLVHPAGAEETAEGGVGAEAQKVGGVAGGVGHGGLLSFGVGFSTAIIPHPADSVKCNLPHKKEAAEATSFYK
jgi:hypothetical protein